MVGDDDQISQKDSSMVPLLRGGKMKLRLDSTNWNPEPCLSHPSSFVTPNCVGVPRKPRLSCVSEPTRDCSNDTLKDRRQRLILGNISIIVIKIIGLSHDVSWHRIQSLPVKPGNSTLDFSNRDHGAGNEEERAKKRKRTTSQRVPTTIIVTRVARDRTPTDGYGRKPPHPKTHPGFYLARVDRVQSLPFQM